MIMDGVLHYDTQSIIAILLEEVICVCVWGGGRGGDLLHDFSIKKI